MKKIFFYSLIALAMVSVSNISHAQTYTLLEPLPSVEEPGKTIPEITINNYITYVFKFAIALAVLLATIMIIIGGFEYMLSESPFGKGNGKTRIQNAAWGLLAAFASYLILQTIDPRLVQINTSIPPICPGGLTTDPNTKESVCNKAVVTDFTQQLTNSLAELKEADKTTVVYNQTENQKDMETIEALKKLRERGPLTPEQETALRTSEASIKRRDAENIKLFARVRGSSAFSKSISNIHNLGNYMTPVFGGLPVLAPSGEVLLADGDFQIKSIDNYVKNLDTLGDHETAQLLRIRKQTYLEQIAEEKELWNDVMTFKISSGKDKTAAESRLKTSLKTYSQPEAREAGFRTDNELMQEYEILKKTRVDLINNTLTTSPKN